MFSALNTKSCAAAPQAQCERRPQLQTLVLALGCNITDKHRKELGSGGALFWFVTHRWGEPGSSKWRTGFILIDPLTAATHAHSRNTKPSQGTLTNTLMCAAWLPALLAAVKNWIRRLAWTCRATTLSHHPWLHPLTVAKRVQTLKWLRGERSRSVNPIFKQTVKKLFTQYKRGLALARTFFF